MLAARREASAEVVDDRDERMRRREEFLHNLQVARRRRRGRLVTRLTWDPDEQPLD